jgi:UDP-N-acetyl-2-amino-2-deoxyglucuronate dehydrogenase
MMPLRVAFIGCGQIAGEHLKGLRALRNEPDAPGLILSAVCDPFPERAEAWIKEHAAQENPAPAVLTDYRDLLKTPHKPDIACVLVPHHLHLEITEALLQAGIAVQLQKPIGLGIRDGRRIVELGAEKGAALVVSEPSVLGYHNRSEIEWLRAGAAIGKPVFMIDQAVIDLQGGFFMTPWRHMKGYAGAGWFIDHGVHRTHWMLEAFGPCRTAYAQTRQLEPKRRNERWGEIAVDTEDCASALLTFESGLICQWSVVSGGRGQGHWHVEIWGERGSLRDRKFTLSGSKLAQEVPMNTKAAPENSFAHSFLELTQLMRDPKAAVVSTAARALEAEAIVYASLESAHTGQPVAIADVLSGKAHAYEDTVWAQREALRVSNLNKFT